jgi:Dyp-type peroxidase family
MTAEHLGASIVGRWRSGAPIMRAAAAENQALGDAPMARNDFMYAIDTPMPNFRPGHEQGGPAFPPAQADPNGFVCPHAAHIRKVNPRDQDSNKGDQFDTLTRRILRRGIPYGEPLKDPLVDDGVDRGLHFLCYQTSIANQFEILQMDWANSTANPKAGGNDLIIGQTGDAPRSSDLYAPTGESATVNAPTRFVVATGGGYFFSPSISALRDVLARAA